MTKLAVLLIRPKSFAALLVTKFVILVAQLSRLIIQNGLEETDQLYYCSYLSEGNPVRLNGIFTALAILQLFFFTRILTFAITLLLSSRFTG